MRAACIDAVPVLPRARARTCIGAVRAFFCDGSKSVRSKHTAYSIFVSGVKPKKSSVRDILGTVATDGMDCLHQKNCLKYSFSCKDANASADPCCSLSCARSYGEHRDPEEDNETPDARC